MRPMTSCASSTAETFFAASATDSSVADLKLHCDLAKACSRFLFDLADDAQFGFRLQVIDVSTGECLSRQHPLHDAVAVDEEVGQCGRQVETDHHQQRPFHRLMQSIDYLSRCRIFRSQHRHRYEIEE